MAHSTLLGVGSRCYARWELQRSCLSCVQTREYSKFIRNFDDDDEWVAHQKQTARSLSDARMKCEQSCTKRAARVAVLSFFVGSGVREWA